MRAAAHANFLCVTSISLAISHGYRSGGFNWELVHENDRRRQHRRPYYHHHQPVVRSDGVIYPDVTAAAKANNISVNAIWQAISRTRRSGRLRRSGGYGWAYQTETPPSS